MSHKCVVQQVVACDSLQTKEDQLVIPKSGRSCLRMPEEVAYESLCDNSNGVSQ